MGNSNLIRLLIIVLVGLQCLNLNAQSNGQFNPYIGRSNEELRMQAYVNARNKATNRAKFQQYMTKANEEFNKDNYSGYITYSNYALKTGFSYPELFYYR